MKKKPELLAPAGNFEKMKAAFAQHPVCRRKLGVEGRGKEARKLVGADSGKISTIISGLPLVSLPKEVVANIVSEVEESLPTGGRFVQFTYNLRRPPESLGFEKMRHIGRSFVALNIPPARVDVFEKIP